MDKRGKNSVKFPPREEDRCSKNQLEDPAVQNKIQQYVDEAFKRVHDGFQREEVTNAIKELVSKILESASLSLTKPEIYRLFGVRPLPPPSFAGSIPGALLTQFVADNILAVSLALFCLTGPLHSVPFFVIRFEICK
ncbi:hypothetical protein niasHS_012303 [Heterodera schachtii]|uniref:Uncharacterized protein n=1 Tax=Heterodera schachtii TaxID=97005 RepID=A0ABD2IGJ4_HETSC